MVRNDLVSYIYQYYMQGYPLDQIQDYLIKTGYQPRDVQEAINYVSYYYGRQNSPPSEPAKVSHTHTLSLKTSVLIVVLVVFVCSVMVSTYLVLNNKERVENKLLDVNTEVIQREIVPGDTVSFRIALSNFGSEGRFDIKMSSEILDQKKFSIAQKEETFALETSSQYVRSIEIPMDTPPGIYEIKVKVLYAEQVASSSSFFTVISDDTPVAVNISVNSTENRTVNITLKINKTLPSELTEHTESQQTIGEILSKVSELPTGEAKDYCDDIMDNLYRDTCFSELAKRAGDPDLCTHIRSVTKKDSCLILFALNDKNFEVCESIQDSKLSISCLQLQKKHDNNASVLSLGW